MKGTKRKLAFVLSIAMILNSLSLGSIPVFAAEDNQLLVDAVQLSESVEEIDTIGTDGDSLSKDDADLKDGTILKDDTISKDGEQIISEDGSDAVLAEDPTDNALIPEEGRGSGDDGATVANVGFVNEYDDGLPPQSIIVNDDKYNLEVRVGDFIYDIYDGTHFAILRKWAPVTPTEEMDVVIPRELDLNTDYEGVYDSGLIDDNKIRKVVGINAGAFAEGEVHRLKSVVIPDTVRMIDAGAFADCTGLTSVQFPESMETSAKEIYGDGFIGDNAFIGCTSLATVTLPKKLDEVGTGIFAECTSLTSIEVPRDWDSTVVQKNKKEYTIREDTVISGPFSFCDSLTTITFAPGTSKIADCMLADCDSIVNIDIPATLTNIGKKAFYGCAALESLNIDGNSSLVNIGDWAFQKCGKLTGAELPRYTKTIGQGAFIDCVELTKTVIPYSISKIGDKAYYNCIELESLSFEDGDPQNISGGTIGSYAFGDNTYKKNIGYSHPLAKLKTVTIPNSITVIGEGAFEGCIGLESLTTENVYATFTGSQKIGKRAFYRCTALLTAVFSDTVESVGESAFEECSALRTVRFNDKEDSAVKSQSIGLKAFYNCTSLDDLRLSDKLTSIGQSAFENCSSLATLTMTNSIQTIGRTAFKSCTALLNLKLPEKLDTIGEAAFSDCSLLESVVIPMSIKKVDISIKNNRLEDSDKEKGIFYKTKLTNVEFRRFNADDGVKIPDKILIGASWVQNIKMPDVDGDGEVTEIGEFAFALCTALKEIDIPDSVVTICGGAFAGCIRLGESKADKSENPLIIPGKVTSIGRSAFKDCSALVHVELPDSLETLGYGSGDGAFENCTSLVEMDIPDNVTEIGGSTFAGCESLERVKLPLSTKDKCIKKIDDQLFMGCMKLAVVENVSQDYLEEIGNRAFYKCRVLTGMNGANTMDFSGYKKLKRIGDEAFYGCDAITEVVLSAATETLGVSVFDTCKSLSALTIGTGPRVIPENAFANDPGLTSVTIPRNVLVIKTGAFSFDIGLTEIRIPKETNIEDNVFSYLNTLTIYGINGSPAQKYADEKGITFVDESVIYANTIRFTDNTPILLKLRGKNNTDRADVPSLDISPVDYSVDVEYTSSNSEVFIVEEYEYNNPVTKLKEKRHRVIATGVGTAELKAQVPKDENNVISASITVTVKKPVERISIPAGMTRENTIIIPDTLQLDVVVTPEDATDKSYTWKSGDENICYVDKNGKVFSKGVGTTKVYAVSNEDPTVLCAFDITVIINWGDITESMQEELFENKRENIPQRIWYAFKGDNTVYYPSSTPQIINVSKYYTGGRIMFDGDIWVYYGINKLVEGRDYTVKYYNNINPAKADAAKAPTVRISGKGSYYKGRENFRFNIEEGEKANSEVKIACLNRKPEYTGDVLTLQDLYLPNTKLGYDKVTLYTEKNGKRVELIEGKDYKFDESQLRDTGSFALRFDLIGDDYKGVVISDSITVKQYDVKKHSDEVKLEYPAAVEFSKAGATPNVIVKCGTKELKEGVDYKVTYSANKKLGTAAKMKVGFLGNYKGTRTVMFGIGQKDVSKLKVFANDIKYKNKKGNFKVLPVIWDDGLAVSKSKDIEKFSKTQGCTYYYASGENIGMPIDDNAILEPDQVVEVRVAVTARANGSYKGAATLSGYYRVYSSEKDIKKAVLIPKNPTMDYGAGNYVNPVYGNDFELKMPKEDKTLTEDNIEIFSISKNRFIGTATVQVRGKNGYGGVKKFKLRIKARSI